MEKLKFVIKGRNYETKPVTIGSFIDLWKARTAISNGLYGTMYLMGLKQSDEVLLAIDMEAFFNVFVPDFMKDLVPQSFKDLGIEDYKEIKDVYVSEIAEWLQKIENLLSPKKEEKSR